MNAQQPLSGDQSDRVRDVVRDLVAEFAPDETSILDDFAESSDAQALHRLKRKTRRREPLGFGIGDLVPLLTPVLWITLTTVLETAVEGGTKSLGRKIRQRIRPKPTEVVPPLTPGKIKEACNTVRAKLIDQGFDEDSADAITEALRRRLKKHEGPGRDTVEE